jgi:hypothetical protein
MKMVAIVFSNASLLGSVGWISNLSQVASHCYISKASAWDVLKEVLLLEQEVCFKNCDSSL